MRRLLRACRQKATKFNIWHNSIMGATPLLAYDDGSRARMDRAAAADAGFLYDIIEIIGHITLLFP